MAALFLAPDQESSLTQLADRLGAPLSTMHGEVKRLTDAGLLVQRHVGRSALVRANSDNRLARPLAELLFLSWGPLHVVAEEFSELEGAERVLIFGSWAARYLERPGPQPHDLDVLVVGAPTRDVVYDAADRAQRRLDIPVNPVIRSASAWRDAADPLVRQIQSAPLVAVLEPDRGSDVQSSPGPEGPGNEPGDTATADEAEDAVQGAQLLITAAERLLPELGFFG